MPDNARRRRAPARQYGQEPARRGQEGRYGQDARRGSDAPHRGGQPARRNGPGRRPRNSGPARPAQPEPYSELDQALSDAAASPEPEIDNFVQLGLPERLIRALAARAGVRFSPVPPTITGIGCCTGLGRAGESVSV